MTLKQEFSFRELRVMKIEEEKEEEEEEEES